MEAKFSPRVKDLISHSRDEAVRLMNEFVGAEHLLLGLVNGNDSTTNMMKDAGLKEKELNQNIKKSTVKHTMQKKLKKSVTR